MPTPAFPEPPASLPATSFADCDAALDRLANAAPTWVRTSLPDRISLLRALMHGIDDVADAWVAASCRAKGHAPGSIGDGEELLGGIAPTLLNLRQLIHALEEGGHPKPASLRQRDDGRWVARVYPADLYDRAMFMGVTADVWITPGKPPSQGRIYRDKVDGILGAGGVCLVLGAGNQASIGPMDALYKLFVEDEVVLLKMNPVNEYLGPLLRKAFAPLVERGFFEVVYGGGEVGAWLCQHPKVTSLHITGSDRTHDLIVWGGDPSEHAARKADGRKANARPMTSELGCVTPVLVVPGPWSEADLHYQARNVASMITHNGSFNCNAAKVVVLARGWAGRARFLELLRAELRKAAPRKAYYPGAQDRYQSFLKHYPGAEVLGARGPEVVPWTLLPNVPARAGEHALTQEAFCGVLAEVSLEATDATEFLTAAVPFANEQLWGTLSCVVLVHPRTEREHNEAVERAITDLRYGAVTVNAWAGLVYGLCGPTWGAYPGHPPEAIGSGTGVVHNTWLFDHPEKSVVRAPFRIVPTPPWFHDHRNLPALAKAFVAFQAAPGPIAFTKLAIAAFQG
jgi:acyl-CoA reductase-like NAD-dependent aldehyde dehydrogenase